MTPTKTLLIQASVVATLFTVLGIAIHVSGYKVLFDFWGSWLLAWELFWGWLTLVVVIAGLWYVIEFGMERMGLVERHPK